MESGFANLCHASRIITSVESLRSAEKLTSDCFETPDCFCVFTSGVNENAPTKRSQTPQERPVGFILGKGCLSTTAEVLFQPTTISQPGKVLKVRNGKEESI